LPECAGDFPALTGDASADVVVVGAGITGLTTARLLVEQGLSVIVIGLPLWLPASEPDSAGFMAVDGRKAQAAGLAVRPLAATVADTARWLATRDNSGAWKHVLSAADERAILAASQA